MSRLSEKNCTACRVDSPLLSEADVHTALLQLPDWEIEDVGGINQLMRVYRFKNFVSALVFTQAVGELAEAYGHHPALLTEWGKVKVSWWTHKIHGVHENDVIMAAKTEQLFLTRFAT
ncbi:MAG: 4a-hydroxytetrahydrobiopterin dehydratase [Cellvibrio sp.]|uniref:4a-hydroxytetrahydrobiopterin dehydratase n=1 Tax=Cellvibrio sp. TaxID=1965322 RepID=UPI00271C6D93|nr:4a-hydroxytetrahydrobiopterin dehydratase [Cellvibrio sp.]